MPHSSESGCLPRKRLRKGTHSCLECRQRKVRCKFEPGAHKCAECLERDMECIPQEARATTVNKTALNNSNSTLPKAQHPTPSSIPTHPLNVNDAGNVPNSAPLFSLFNQTTSHDLIYPQKSRNLGYYEFQVLHAVKIYMPSMQDLTSLLICGQRSWRVWLQSFPNPLTTMLNGPQEEQASRLCGLIYTYVHSEDCALVAKVVLCIALHLQQLPLGSKYADESLQQNCLASAELLLASDEGLGGTLDGLECMLLQAEYYINVSNLRRVWITVRKAVNTAQMLGLHQPLENANHQLLQRRQKLWMELWQMDRGFSMILGLPCATLDTQYPEISPDMHEARFLCDLGVIMGRIVARNQSRSQTTYSATLEIDEALDQCQELMTRTWWGSRPPVNASPDMVFLECSKKFRFYTARKLVHLPFLLKAYTDRRYEGSRVAVLEASKAIIEVFSVLRDEKLGVPKMCDMADFEAFCAAMTIVVDLVGRPPRDDEESDWQIILSLANDLKRVSQTLNCSVAGKGARVLNEIHHSRNHSGLSNSQVCELDIPYFVKISLHRAPLEYATLQ